jgi:F-type H+-transporting ATPase subunit b
MLIDWFTVGAQVTNFLILVYLLKRFLYKPVIKAMDERERKIATRLEQAQKQRKTAAQERDIYLKKNKELDGKRDTLLFELEQAVEKKRNAMMREVRTEVEGARTHWYEVLEREKEAFLKDLQYRAGQYAYAVARRAFDDLANQELEAHVIRIFEKRLEDIDKEDFIMLRKALIESKGKALLRSAFPISHDTVQNIASFLKTLEAIPVDLELDTSADLICGIELIVHGNKIAWSLGEYLESQEGLVSQAFDTGLTSDSAQALSEKKRQTNTLA